MSWLERHLVGGAVFAPAVLLLAALAFYAWGTHRKRYLPWLFLSVWAAAVVVHYFVLHIGRLLPQSRHLWAAQLLTLAIVTALPLALTVLPYAVPAQRTATRRGLALTGLVVGLLSILLVAPLSEALGQLLDQFVQAGTR